MITKLQIMIATMSHSADNYKAALQQVGLSSIVSVNPSDEAFCAGLLLPGGGDIAPALFHDINSGSHQPDFKEDLRQIELFYQFLNHQKPILGICKGMQIINIALGGNLIQHLKTHSFHEYINHDQYHITKALPGGIFHKLYGTTPVTNSAHHQGLFKLGPRLRATQYSFDGVIEGIEYPDAPVFGTQWHPERLLDSTQNHINSVNGLYVFQYFKKLLLQ